MKTLFTFSFVICFVLGSISQTTPEAFIAGIPVPPNEVCTMSKDSRENFSGKIEALQEQLTEEIKTRKEEYKNFAGNNNEKIQQNMAGQMGLSPAEMAKLQKGGKMSQAQAMEMANKMMGQQNNMSVDEAKKMSKMSKEDQQGYAEGMTTGMMADAQANPGKYKTGQKKDMQMYELAAEQTKLAQQIQAEDAKIQKQLAEINSKDLVEKKKLDEQLAPLKEELDKINDGEGSTAADAAHAYAVAMKMYNLELKYCELMTPIYTDFLNRHLVSVKTNLPVCYRLQEITDQLTAAQTGVKIDEIAPDLIALDSISRYLTLLKEAFRFAPMEKPTKG